MRLIPVIFFSLITFCSFAQLRHPIHSNDKSGYSIGTYGRYQVATNAISSELIWQAFQGKALQRSTRDAVSNRLSEYNSVGVDLDYGLYACFIPDSNKFGWYLNIADRTHANAKYPRDLFNLIMFGNADFAGKTADLSDIKAQFFTYKQYEVGLLKSVDSESGKWQMGVGVSLLTGNRNLNIDMASASLFTHEDGEFVDAALQGEIQSSSLTSFQYFDANGLGMSTSLSVAYENETFGLRLDADDLGFIRWSQQLQRTVIDTSFRFEGAELNLFSNDGASFGQISADSAFNGIATTSEANAYSTVLPGRIRLEGHYQLNEKKLRLYAGLQYRIAARYLPYGYVGVSSPLPHGFYLDGRFAYGGFGSWHLGFEVRKMFSDVIQIRLGTNNLEGYVLPMFGTSQSLYVGLSGHF